jgi:hypothetical protein
MRIALAIVLLIAAAALSTDVSARSKMFWLGRDGLGQGKLGAAGSKGSNGTAPTGCTGTSLAFNVPCNSMYLTVVH